jgi:hypothetical protein
MSMLEFLRGMPINPSLPTARPRPGGLARAPRRIVAVLVGLLALVLAAGAQASVRLHIGSRTVTVSITATTTGTYTLRSAPGQSQRITLSGMTVADVLTAAGLTPSTVSGVTVGSVGLSPIDIADPSDFPDGPALFTVSSGTTRFFRPTRNVGDVNAADYIQTPPGLPLDVFVSSGTPSVPGPSVDSSTLSVTADVSPTQLPSGQTAFFTAIVANPPVSGAPLDYSWSFGDGASSLGAGPSHAYATDGDYLAVVTVTSQGARGQASVTVHVGHPHRTTQGTGLGTTNATGSGGGGSGTGKGGTGGGNNTGGGKGVTQPKAAPKQPVARKASTPGAAAKAAAAHPNTPSAQPVHGVLLADIGSPLDLRLSPPPPSGSPGPAHKSAGGSAGFPAALAGIALALVIVTLGGLAERRRVTLGPA